MDELLLEDELRLIGRDLSEELMPCKNIARSHVIMEGPML